MHDSHYVDPEVRPILAALQAQFGDYTRLSVAQTREMYARRAAATAKPLPPTCIDGRFTVHGVAGAIECRWFKPLHATGSLPVLLHFLGGTYVATSLDQVGGLPIALALALDCIVVVPLHRIPPEHPFPAALDDCFAVYRWLLRSAADLGGDAARIVIHGESSGGTLAALVCITARDQHLPQPCLQVLAEPLVDHQSETSSINEFSYVLGKQAIRFGSRLYFGDAPPPASASPLRVESLQHLAPAYVITAGLDPLRDEGIAFVTRLRHEGVLVVHRHHDGQIHGFHSMFDQLTQSRIAFAECCAAITLAFSGALSRRGT